MQLRYLILFCITFSFSIRSVSQVCITGGTPASPITMASQNNFTISGLRIYNQTNTTQICIYLINCHNVRIENCVLGPSTNEGIKLVNCTNVTITNCHFMDNSTGVLADGGSGIKVLNNQFLNAKGGFPRGQAVQFITVSGAGNEISYNVVEQVPGNSKTEDNINLYKSNGTSASPILVKGNKIRGGGPSWGSGGILAGDEGGSYQRLEGNIVVDPGRHGVSIAGGDYNQIIDNKVYGRRQPLSNIAYYAYNVYWETGGACSNITVTGNESNLLDSAGNLSGFYGGNDIENNRCSPVAVIENNNFNATFGPEILPARLLCPLLVAHYPFNNSFQDISGSGLNGGSPNVTFAAEGKDLACANFSGATYMPMPFSPWTHVTSNRITVSTWIKPATVQGIKAIATSPDADGYNDGWRLLLIDGTLNGRITTTLGSVDAFAAGIQPGQWTFVAMTYDGQQVKLYINGVLSGSASIGGNILYGNYGAQMLVGFSPGTNYYFNGQMDEFKFYNGDFTAAEMLQAYNNDKDQFDYPRQLIVHYKFNASFNDASGNNLHATNSGAGFICDGADAISATFNGSSLVSLPFSNNLKPVNKFYISCWIKPTTVQGIKAITHVQDADGYTNGWRLILIDGTLNGRLVTTSGAVDVYAGGVQAGAWNHVALMYDGAALKLFLNGQLQGSTAAMGNTVYGGASSQKMRIGFTNGSNYYFNGRIDEFRFYNGVISQQEVLGEYNTGLAAINNPPPCPLRVMVKETAAPKTTNTINSRFNIYPNPAVAELFISAGTSFQASLFNATGQRILQGSDRSGILRLDTKDIKPGVYFLQVTGKDFQETRKILIQR